jgi:hypothetical protein
MTQPIASLTPLDGGGHAGYRLVWSISGVAKTSAPVFAYANLRPDTPSLPGIGEASHDDISEDRAPASQIAGSARQGLRAFMCRGPSVE